MSRLAHPEPALNVHESTQFHPGTSLKYRLTAPLATPHDTSQAEAKAYTLAEGIPDGSEGHQGRCERPKATVAGVYPVSVCGRSDVFILFAGIKHENSPLPGWQPGSQESGQ